MQSEPQDLREFYDAVGRAALCAELGFASPSALSNRYAEGLMPARWYAKAKALADRKGVACPMRLFDWRHTDAA